MRFTAVLFVLCFTVIGSSLAAEIDVPPADADAIEALASADAHVSSLYQDSPLLRVSFAQSDQPASDADVALLAGVALQTVELNVARSAITDAGVAPLASLENLATLHLELTDVGDDALLHLAGLKNLEYLNLYGTKLTDAGLEHLKGLAKLKKLYLWQTTVSYDAARKLEESIEGLQVNLGWNHPEVMKRRLTKELEDVTARKQGAAKRAEAAKIEEETATAREAEIQKKLAELNPQEEPPAEEKKEAPAEDKNEEKKAASPEEKKE